MNLIWVRSVFDDALIGAAQNNLNNLIEDADWQSNAAYEHATVMAIKISLTFYEAATDECPILTSIRKVGQDNDVTIGANPLAVANIVDEDWMYFHATTVALANAGPFVQDLNDTVRVKRKISSGQVIQMNQRTTRAAATCDITGIVSVLLKVE